MDITLRPLIIAACCIPPLVFSHESLARQNETVPYAQSLTATYSQKTLLKNWALSVCFAKISKEAKAIEDANATASAYLEFGKQGIEDYEKLQQLVERYVNLKYAGSVESDFNTMKCIDLFHSKALDDLTGKLAKRK